MTNPKIKTYQINNHRYYEHPNLKNVTAPSVTSVLDMLPSPFLRAWNSKMTAQAAMANLDYINELAASGNSNKAIEWLKNAASRELDKAADIGTRVHEAFENRIIDPTRPFDADLAPFIERFDIFCNRFEPEWLHVEKSVFSLTHLYAGSFDAIARINKKTMILDFKTTRSGISPKVALQLAAYARADVMFDGDKEIAIPHIDGAAALWIRPDNWSFQPLRIDDDIFEMFLSLRRVFEWEARHSKTAMLAPMTYKGAL
jgi:hypothetical protein